jgi:hypothetical protein
MSQERIAEPFIEILLPAGEVTPKLSVIVRLLEQDHITRASNWKKNRTQQEKQNVHPCLLISLPKTFICDVM